jgi:hypothetical protein
MTRGTDDPADDGLLISVTISGGRRHPGTVAARCGRDRGDRPASVAVPGLRDHGDRSRGRRLARRRTADPDRLRPRCPGTGPRRAARTAGRPRARRLRAGHGPVTTSPDPLLAVAGWACLGLVVLTVVGGLVTWSCSGGAAAGRPGRSGRHVRSRAGGRRPARSVAGPVRPPRRAARSARRARLASSAGPADRPRGIAVGRARVAARAALPVRHRGAAARAATADRHRGPPVGRPELPVGAPGGRD